MWLLAEFTFHGLLARSHPQFPACIDLSNGWPPEEESLLEVTAYHHCYVLLVRSSHTVPPTMLQGRCSHVDSTTGRGHPWWLRPKHPRVYLQTPQALQESVC